MRNTIRAVLGTALLTGQVFSATAFVRIAAEQDDGSLLPGDVLMRDAVISEGQYNAIGTAGALRDLGARFRFRIDKPAEYSHARLKLPARSCSCSSTVVAGISTSAGSRRTILWNLEAPWDCGERGRPYPLYTPDIAALVNEAMRAADWNGELLITVKPQDGWDGGLLFHDWCEDGVWTPELQLRETVRDTLVARELLGRPEDDSVEIWMMSLVHLEARARAGAATGSYSKTSEVFRAGPMEPLRLRLDDLNPDTRYYYRCDVRLAGTETWTEGPEGTFHTARARGKRFVFGLVADEHLQNQLLQGDYDAIYEYDLTLANLAQSGPDFYVSLGDFAHVEFYHGRDAYDLHEALDRYLEQRSHIDAVCGSIPFFLCLGNHEGEQGWRLDGTADNVAVWGALARKMAVPNPEPGAFYCGEEAPHPFVGRRAAYYSWEWGDALFVVLDPYWFTTENPNDKADPDTWRWTLGREQYEWLQATLTRSDARWKLVFSHQETGGTTPYGRGGIESAKHRVDGRPSFEWGGEDESGADVFGEMRPGWSHGPIHDMLVDCRCTMFLHGHDHGFAHQMLDGITYLECPTPNQADSGMRYLRHYTHGHLEPSPGHVRFTVGPESILVEYVKTSRDEAENGTVAYSFTIPGPSPNPEIPHEDKHAETTSWR